ncbi:tetratricopeptide repeat (TPR)-like superfamily protein [Actinidia rufa]|uniref:Tetratricopeptide repeat (TPR)-like superfamily protein n=1 Tax=Actinidia rufa TaxID=165716 RepID=A0A7J0FIB2_9ERIC|nr:tetratricopeptide repeat (TPR)-like superfamily protein [Actinidia rufa]
MCLQPLGLRLLRLSPRIRVSIRLHSSLSALCAVESSTESPILLQEHHQNLPNQRYTKQKARERIEKNVVTLGNEESVERLRGYSSMLHICALKGFLKEGKAIHGHVIKNGTDPDDHLWNCLANFYAKCGSHQFARKVFEEMPERDVVSWTSLIAGLIDDGYERDGLRLFCDMHKDGLRPNGCTLATSLKGCSMCLDIDLGEQILGEVIKIGFLDDLFVGSSLVDLYAKCGEMELANRAFLSIPEWNVVSWSALLSGYAQSGEGEEVLKLFSTMTEFEMKFSCFTLATVLKGCSKSGKLREAQALHSMAIKVGCEVQEYVSCSLLNIYSNLGQSDDALKVFGRIKDPNIVAWSEMIDCLNQQGLSKEAAELFGLMRHKGIKPNQFTLTRLVSAATDLCDQHYGESIHACIVKYGFESDNYINNALTVMYMKLGSVRKGWLVFETIIDRDLASWNALFSGVDNDETCGKKMRIFKQILADGLKPDIYTFCSVLRHFTCLSDVKFGEQVHAHIVKGGLSGNNYVGTALINMYANNRRLAGAGIIFNRLQKKDLLTWTVIIAGYVQNDEGDKAIECFSQMQQEGLKPNEFTLSSCLSACSNLATLETGRQFHSLALKFGISGSTYVASALVDMYAKCRSIEAKGKWVDVAKVRALMASCGIEKEPGCSWVKIDAQAHMFFAQDGSDPKINEICLRMGELSR